MVSGPYRFDFDLQFGSLLSGFFTAGNTSDLASFFGADGNPIISIGTADNDNSPCSHDDHDHCPTRGAWLLDRSTIPVPEPLALTVLGVGLVGLAFARHRKQ